MLYARKRVRNRERNRLLQLVQKRSQVFRQNNTMCVYVSEHFSDDRCSSDEGEDAKS